MSCGGATFDESALIEKHPVAKTARDRTANIANDLDHSAGKIYKSCRTGVEVIEVAGTIDVDGSRVVER